MQNVRRLKDECEMDALSSSEVWAGELMFSCDVRNTAVECLSRVSYPMRAALLVEAVAYTEAWRGYLKIAILLIPGMYLHRFE